MNVQDIISNALIEYDSAQPVIEYLLKKCNRRSFSTNNDWQELNSNLLIKNRRNNN